MKEGVIVLNPNGLIVDYNHAMRKIIPSLSTHSIGKSIVDILGEDQQLSDILCHHSKSDYEFTIDGERRHYEIMFSPVHGKTNQLAGQIINFIDITERVNMQEKLQHLAIMDGLTQVFNRTFYVRKSEEIFETLIQSGGNVSVIMFDIDHFKQVNDTFGHEAGDTVLTHVVDIAKGFLSPTDIMGRYGGEEFIMSLPGATLSEASEVANSIREKVSESFTYIHEDKIRVTLSFGISCAFIEAGEDRRLLATLMRQADQALYDAKRNGRNCVRIYKEAHEFVRS